MPCPCTVCNGKRLLKIYKVRTHLIRDRRSLAFRVWKGPGEYDSSDAEWEAFHAQRPIHPHRDEGMDMRSMIQNNFMREHGDMEDRVQDIAIDALNFADDVGEREDDADSDFEDNVAHQRRNDQGQFQQQGPRG